jgi:hypothetical protein
MEPIIQAARDSILDRVVKLDPTMTRNQAQLLCTIMRNEARYFVLATPGNSRPNCSVLLVPYDLQSAVYVIGLPEDGTDVQFNRLDHCTPSPLGANGLKTVMEEVSFHISRLTQLAPVILRQPSEGSIFDRLDHSGSETAITRAQGQRTGPFPNGVGGGAPTNNGPEIMDLPLSTQSTFSTTCSTLSDIQHGHGTAFRRIISASGGHFRPELCPQSSCGGIL